VLRHPHRTADQQGAALIIALLMLALLTGIAAALVTVSATETLISATYRYTAEASHAAEAALERAVHDLANLPDWTPVVVGPPANVTSSFVDGLQVAVAPDGQRLDLTQLTAARQ
jgi:Tfp pilus assembly protein PilX